MLLADAEGVSDGFCGRHGDGDGVFNGWVILRQAWVIRPSRIGTSRDG